MNNDINSKNKFITCILYHKGGTEVLRALHKRGINSVSLHQARGSAIGDPVGRDGLPVSFEKDILTVIVPAEIADEIFEFIFDTAAIDRPYGGFLYMGFLHRSSEYCLENLPEENNAALNPDSQK